MGAVTATGGPPRFFALLHHQGSLLAGTCGRGITRSADRGLTWEPVAGGPATVHALVAGPAGEIWAAGSGLHRSDDAGRSWSAIGLGGLTVHAVNVDEHGVVVGTVDHGVIRSTDGGRSWLGGDGPLGSSTVHRLVRDADGELLAATADRGVWRVAVERGRLVGRPSGLDGLSVFALVLLDGWRVLAGTRGAGVLGSDDGGRTWLEASDSLPDPVVHVLAPGEDGAVYAGTGRGIAWSTDGGRTWEPCRPELAHHRIFSIARAPWGQLFCGSYDGVWTRSPGTGWISVDTGLSADDAYAVTVDHSGDAYSATASGVLRSLDAGLTWESAGLDGRHVYTVVPLASGGYLAGTDDGVLAYRDSGWVGAGLDRQRVYRIIEVEPGRLLAATLGAGVWRGDDGRWEQVTALDHELALDISRTRAGPVLVATGTVAEGVKTGGIFLSEDLGATWRPAACEPMTVYRIVESSMGMLFAGGQRCRILRSADGGGTWSTLHTAPDAKMFGLAIDQADRLYLGAGAQLLISDDGAETWQEAGDGLDGATVFDVATHPGGALLAATSFGLFRSLDRGLAWEPVSARQQGVGT